MRSDEEVRAAAYSKCRSDGNKNRQVLRSGKAGANRFQAEFWDQDMVGVAGRQEWRIGGAAGSMSRCK